MAVVGEGNIHERLLLVQQELEKAQRQYDSVVRVVGEVIYENEQLTQTIGYMLEELSENRDQRSIDASDMGKVTLARFGAEKREEGEAQASIQA